MKEKVFLIVASMALLFMMGTGVVQSNKNELSELMLSNIEALAGGIEDLEDEDGSTPGGGGGGSNKIKCYETVTAGSGTKEYVGYCGTCSAVKATDYNTQRFCYE